MHDLDSCVHLNLAQAAVVGSEQGATLAWQRQRLPGDCVGWWSGFPARASDFLRGINCRMILVGWHIRRILHFSSRQLELYFVKVAFECSSSSLADILSDRVSTTAPLPDAKVDGQSFFVRSVRFLSKTGCNGAPVAKRFRPGIRVRQAYEFTVFWCFPVRTQTQPVLVLEWHAVESSASPSAIY